MVAYSFVPPFRQQVAELTKRQTVRAHRKRHARPGEPIQLYAAMRTQHCRKLVKTDPVCVSVSQIEISTSELIDGWIASIVIDGVPLNRHEIETFAAADGFDPGHFGMTKFPSRTRPEMELATARYWMGWWWTKTHGAGRFCGVIIKWEPST